MSCEFRENHVELAAEFVKRVSGLCDGPETFLAETFLRCLSPFHQGS